MGDYLSGYSIFGTDECTSQETTYKNSLFIEAQRNNEYLKEYGYTNKSVRYGNILDRLKSDLKSQLGSMAFEDKNDYSEYTHTHDRFNKFQISSINYSEGVPILGIKIGNSYNRVYDYDVQFEDYPENYIGQLKIVASTQDFSKKDINDADFDGWVYANGKKYITSGFEKAKDEFVSDVSSFTVPEISGFFRFKNDKIQVQEQYPQKIDYSLKVPYHTHGGSVFVEASKRKASQEDNVFIKTQGSDSVSGKGTCVSIKKCSRQYSSFSPEPTAHLVLRSNKAEIDSVNIQKSDEKLEVETHPSYTTVQVLVYIGKE